MPEENAMLAVLEFLFAPFRDRLYDSYFKKRHRNREWRRQISTTAISRIQKERPNFQHIVAGTGYRSDDHRRAVEQISFQLLQEAIAPLQNVRKFRKPAKSLLEQIEIRNAAGVLIAIDLLEPKLTKFVGH